MNYTISSNQIGSGSIGRIFKIRTKEPPYKYKIIKIFEEQGYAHYIREKIFYLTFLIIIILMIMIMIMII